MKNKKYLSYYFIAFIILLSTATQAKTTLSTINNNPQNTDNEKKTLTFYQDSSTQKLILNSPNHNYTIEIFDDEGQVIKTLQLKKNVTLIVPTDDIKSGNYFLRYISKNKKNNSVKKLTLK